MSEDEPDLATVAGLLEDETVRTILTETSQEPMSARSLKTHCDASGPTVYRRLERLREANLLVERTRVDTADGHHRTEFAPNVERITMLLEDGTLRMRVDRPESMADRFTRLVEDI